MYTIALIYGYVHDGKLLGIVVEWSESKKWLALDDGTGVVIVSYKRMRITDSTNGSGDGDGDGAGAGHVNGDGDGDGDENEGKSGMADSHAFNPKHTKKGLYLLVIGIRKKRKSKSKLRLKSRAASPSEATPQITAHQMQDLSLGQNDAEARWMLEVVDAHMQ